MQERTKIGIVGTGFIAKGLYHALEASDNFTTSKMLTRRDTKTIEELPQEILTNSFKDFLDNSDIVFECSGDVYHATDIIMAATQANKKVVTMNSEFHVTAGTYFIKRGHYVSEADGDQPGCLARLKQEVEGMGFEPLAYVNLKGYLNPNPELEEMIYWSEKQQNALNQVISFTDGTKVQIEQAFVANGLGATIAQDGLIGATVETLYDMDYMVRTSDKLKQPISEYVLCKGSPPGILIVAKNKIADKRPGYLAFSKIRTKEDLAYVLLRPYHLCYLECINTLNKVVAGEPMLLNNTVNPTITVGAVAKKAIKKDDIITLGAGGFDVRGMAIKIEGNKDKVPICLLKNTRVIRDIEQGQLLTFDDVELEPSQALICYLDSFE
jgi:predicted homoserine dehydrogenase-like protein